MPIRGVIEYCVPHELCEELAYLHRSIGVVGYRPHVRSTTLFDLTLAEPRLLPAVVRARQLVWDCVEDYFDRQCQVFVEHTSLISWHPGADYLAQRHYSAVLYLNTQGEGFSGGTFSFKDGPPPLRVSPAAGTLLVYTADERNVHQVEEVTAGERLTLTMWFTLDEAFQEDKKVLSQLLVTGLDASGLPGTMYLSSKGSKDIRLQQLQDLGILWVEGSSEVELQQSNKQHVANMHQAPHQREEQLVALKASSAASAGVPRSADGTAGPDPLAVYFDSLQQAVLTAHMVLWKLCPHRQQSHTAPPTAVCSGTSNTQQVSLQTSTLSEQHRSGTSVGAAGSNLQSGAAQPQAMRPVWSCPTCCCSKVKMTEALQLLDSHLQAGEHVVLQSLQKWVELGMLVGSM